MCVFKAMFINFFWDIDFLIGSGAEKSYHMQPRYAACWEEKEIKTFQ